MAGYEGGLFDANGPMQFATQVRGIADALDSVNEKAQSFFQSTQAGLESLTQALSNFSGATGGFNPGGGGGGSGWAVGRPNSGGTGGRQGNDMGVGGYGNNPPPFSDMTGGAPVGGYSNFSPGRVAEAGIGVATGMAQRYQAQTETPSLQFGLAAQQGALMSGQGVNAAMTSTANNQMLAPTLGDLSIGTSAMQNLFGVPMTGRNSSRSTLGSSVNTIELMNPSVGYTGAAQAMAGLNSPGAYRAQMTLLGTAARMNGQYQSPEVMINDLFNKFPQLQTMDDASFEQDITNGNMYQNLLAIAGNDPVMLQTLQNMARARRNSSKALPAQMSGGQLRGLGLSYKPATDQLQRQSTTSHTQAQVARGQNQALSDFNRAVQGFTQAVNSLFGGAPGVAYGVGYGSSSLSHVGGPVGTAVGFANSLTGGLFGGLLGGGGGGGSLGVGGGGGGVGVGGGGGLSPANIVSLFLGYKGLKALSGVGGLRGLLGKLPGFGGSAAADAESMVTGAAADAGGAAAGAGGAAAGAGGVAADAGGALAADAGGALAADAGIASLGGLGMAAAIPLAGVGAFYGTTKALDAIFGKPQNVKPSTSATQNTTNTLNFKVTGGVIDPSDRARLIQEALSLANQPLTPTNINDVGIIIGNESGWQPNAQNNTDSNAKAGNPSQGLMQLIPSTFNAYRDPKLPESSIKDPLNNTVAGIKYAVARYGSLDKVPGVEAVLAGKSYVGYERGSFEIEKTKLALLHKGERVIRSADNTVSSRYGGGTSAAHHHVHYHFSSGAIAVTMPGTDMVTASQSGAALADAMVERLSRA